MFEGLTLRIEAGETLVVLGASGSGKTTLAGIITGTIEPAAGRVDRSSLLTSEDENRLSIGLVTQNPEDTFTSPVVREEMGMVLQNLSLDDRSIDSAVDRMLAETGLAEHAELPPSLLSGGQKQTLALAAVLVADPHLLVLDEPLSLLDGRWRKTISTMISARMNEGTRAMVYLSSAVEDALRGEKCAVLSGGRIAWQGLSCDLPLDGETLEGWGLVLPELSRLCGLLFPAGAGEARRLWRPLELAEHLCR